MPSKFRWGEIKATRQTLVDIFPNCFMPSSAATKKALKVGVDNDIILSLAAKGRDLSPALLRRTLHAYTAGEKYARALADGGPRVDLDGNPAGEIAEVIRARARTRLAQMAAERTVREAARSKPDPQTPVAGEKAMS